MSKSLAIMLVLVLFASPAAASTRPNVLLVITDDQGYGDLGFHGNPVLKTPNLDAFAKASVRMTRFQVCPVCSPTRSSLMTGRYNYRTGVVDTYIGRSMMHPDEVTLGEVLREAGYRTGLFGKWHLGDCYPMRPQDQGFQEVLMHKGGGIAQPSDPPGGSSYHDPILFQNGDAKKFPGYVTDVITTAAIDFMTRKRDQPFLAYVAFNCPHAPYQVVDEDWKPYRGIALGPDAFPMVGSPWTGKKLNQEEIARAYGMIANIDHNFGRLLAKVPENTLVIFLTDNGPGGVRWNAGLRNRKGTVYDGGIRVPFFAQWKGQFKEDKSIDVPAAHIDIGPTILEACGLGFPKGVKIDGRSLLSLLQGKKTRWQDRYLFTQWHRGDIPEKGRAFAVRGPRYKLVQAAGVGVGKYQARHELFDMTVDPYEQKDLSAEKPEVVRDLLDHYLTWFQDMKSTRNFEGPRIHLGSKREKVTTLTRQDWRGPKAGWAPEDEGHWDVMIVQEGRYRVTLTVEAAPAARKATIQATGAVATVEIPAGKSTVVLEDVRFRRGESKLEAWVEGVKRTGVRAVEVERTAE